MINKPRVLRSPKLPAEPTFSFIKWCSISSPRPSIGIEGVLYVDKERNTLSIWSNAYKTYVVFGGKGKLEHTEVTTNNNAIVDSTSKENSSYSFNLINDNLIITCPDGIIQEIPIPSQDTISTLNDKISSLESRIEELEKLLS